MLKVGHRVSASAIRGILKALKILPAPARDTGTTWRQFLRAQAATMFAAGLLPADCAVTLQRLYCLFAIEASRARLEAQQNEEDEKEEGDDDA